ncbi:MAG: diacylglycerol O-acyltransferase / wax synthase, partial [Acidimicrobiaceae bacterium]
MKQLSGIDATFLYMESASQFGHVSSLSVFERPADPTYVPLDAWRAQIEARLHLLEPLRRRLVSVPLGLDHPFWIEDPDFDLDFHVRHTAIPPPGSDEQLAELVARIVGRPLDRARPLWETYVIEGLPDGRFGVLTKIHHATVDGAAGAELLTLMLDADAAGDDVPAPDHEWRPDRAPSDVEVVTRAAANLVRKPGRALLLSARAARQIGEATRNPALVA